MNRIPKEQVHRRMQIENPWWSSGSDKVPFDTFKRRAYFDLFQPLLKLTQVRRAILLMGPRRVGKTVLLHQAIRNLMDSGVPPKSICYISVDHPIYNGCGLEDLLESYLIASETPPAGVLRYVFFDEIQYLRDWEIHLKLLVDSHPDCRFVASGSAAAALRLKSQESGAGRFTEFLLPPLTFHEYLELLDLQHLVSQKSSQEKGGAIWSSPDIHALNRAFLHYLNFGGYPEVIFSEQIQADPGRFIKNDIIDKVLLRDLPGLYGIQDIQELNSLFTTLAFNTAQEVSLEALSQSAGVAKNTIKRYIDYLEAAFLIKVVHRIDRSAKKFMRANFFKVYLTNPSIRSALFAPLSENDEATGPLAETGIFSQWFHSQTNHYYARWSDGEVDIVSLDAQQRPSWSVEVKWSDRFAEHPRELRSLIQFCRANRFKSVMVTSRTASAIREVGDLTIRFVPASLYCYTVGHNLVRGKDFLTDLSGTSRALATDESL